MKKVGSLALALLLSLCCLVGCLAEGSPEKTDYYYIFIPKLVHSWYDAVQAGIATAEEELESTYGVNITVEWLAPSVADGVEQADILESAIAKQPDGIALSVVDQDMVASIIDEALDMGINLITFDTDGSSTNRLAFVGMSSEGNIGEGRSAAEWMAEQMGYEGEVAILAGTPTAQNHKEKVQGS